MTFLPLAMDQDGSRMAGQTGIKPSLQCIDGHSTTSSATHLAYLSDVWSRVVLSRVIGAVTRTRSAKPSITMQLLSTWPAHICLAGVAGFTLGSSPWADALTHISGAPTTAPQMAIVSEDGDRGSGRLRQPSPVWQAGIRGSGRVNPAPPSPSFQTEVVTYRGSGRIQPANPSRTNLGLALPS